MTDLSDVQSALQAAAHLTQETEDLAARTIAFLEIEHTKYAALEAELHEAREALRRIDENAHTWERDVIRNVAKEALHD